MSVEPSVHQHRTLHVDLIAHLEQAEVGTVERLLHGRDGIMVAVDVDHGEAYAVVTDALINLQLVSKWTGKGEVYILTISLDSNNRCHAFYDSTKHKLNLKIKEKEGVALRM